jgi:hypothetical protein
MRVIPDFKSTSRLAELKRNGAPGTKMYTDGLKSFTGLQEPGFQARAWQPTFPNRPTGWREIGCALGGPRDWQSAAMVNRDLSGP